MKIKIEALESYWFSGEVQKKWGSLLQKFNGIKFYELQDLIRNCISCRVRPEARRPVPPIGNTESEYIFCGRNPGRSENKYGIPFYYKAPSGKLIEKWMEVLKVFREDIYITNALFCHTKQNRKPLSDEIFICVGWKLIEFTFLKNARYIFLFGTDAVYSFFGRGSITTLFGSIVQTKIGNKKYIVFPFYHPAYVLRNPDLAQASVNFMAIAREAISLDKEGRLRWVI